MTRSCKDVLKHLRDISENTSAALLYVYGETRICSYIGTEKKYYDYSRYDGEFDAIIAELIKGGYLELLNDHYSIALTYKGLHPYKIAWEDLKSFLVRSIAVPIVVSAITTVITFYITAALSQ